MTYATAYNNSIFPFKGTESPQATYQGPALFAHKKHSLSVQAQSRCSLTTVPGCLSSSFMLQGTPVNDPGSTLKSRAGNAREAEHLML